MNVSANAFDDLTSDAVGPACAAYRFESVFFLSSVPRTFYAPVRDQDLQTNGATGESARRSSQARAHMSVLVNWFFQYSKFSEFLLKQNFNYG